MVKNEYTDEFATKVELNSSITQLSNDITLEVNGKIDNVDKDLNAKLELKVDTENLISEINASAYVINLESNRFSMKSEYSSINQDGIVDFKGGKVGGWSMDEHTLSCDIVPPYDYSQDDVTRLREILAGTITPTASDYQKYDFHNDGNIDMTDLIICRRLVDNNLMNSNPGKLIFDTSDWFNPIKIINSSGVVIASFGVGGTYVKEINE